MASTYRVRTRRWTRAEYDRLIENGVFPPDGRLELIDGELIVKEPQGAPHHSVIELVAATLRAAFGPGWFVRVQGPVALDAVSQPELDVSVARGGPRDYLVAHPAWPVLVVEVSEATRAFDRGCKASLYARAGIADYWMVDLVARRLEVRRDPVSSSSAQGGGKYRSVRLLGPGDSVPPLAAPAARIRVSDLLP